MNIKLLHNPTPGEILKEEFLDVLNISQNQLAKAINVPSGRISQVINNKRKVTADTDLRLCKFFRLSEGYFLRLQSSYDIMEVKRNNKNEIMNIIPYEFQAHTNSA
jgi:addiction module HigA family antidote